MNNRGIAITWKRPLTHLASVCDYRMREAARSNGEQCAPMDRLARSLQCGFSSPVQGTDIALEAQRAKLQRVVETAREATPTA